MATIQTLNAMNIDSTLILLREKYILTFWIILASGIGAFAISKAIK